MGARRRAGRRVGRFGWILLGLAIAVPGLARAHPGADAQIAALDARIARDPGDKQLRLQRAELLRRAGHLHDALADLAVVARTDPDDESLLIERALVRIAQGRARSAERDLDAAIGGGSRSIVAHRERAKLREASGRLEAAIADYDAAVATGGSPDLFLARARLHERAGELDAAAEGLAEGCAALSDPVVLRLALVQAERQRARPDRALEVIDALVDTAPRRADWVLVRAEILAELAREPEALGERLRALALSNAAIATRPTALHRLSRARVYLALERPAAALDDLEAVIAAAPDLPEAHTLLRRAREALG